MNTGQEQVLTCGSRKATPVKPTPPPVSDEGALDDFLDQLVVEFPRCGEDCCTERVLVKQNAVLSKPSDSSPAQNPRLSIESILIPAWRGHVIVSDVLLMEVHDPYHQDWTIHAVRRLLALSHIRGRNFDSGLDSWMQLGHSSADTLVCYRCPFAADLPGICLAFETGI